MPVISLRRDTWCHLSCALLAPQLTQMHLGTLQACQYTVVSVLLLCKQGAKLPRLV